MERPLYLLKNFLRRVGRVWLIASVLKTERREI